MMELGATVCGARAARCERLPASRAGAPRRARRGRAARGAPARASASRTPTRWVRGRVVAALAAGDGLPAAIAAGAAGAGARRRSSRDGLVVMEQGGARLA